MTKSDSAAPLSRHDMKTMRGWADVLSLWRLCNNGGCRRARACGGNARVCYRQNIPLLPEGVQAWFAGVGRAQDDKLSYDAAIEWLETMPAGEAFHDWNEAVKESLGG